LELSSLIIGRRGTDSAALSDHHAVTFLPATSGTPGRLALPMRMHDTPYPYGQSNPDNPSTYYDWTHTGLYLFNISADVIELAGKLIIANRATGDAPLHDGYGGDRSVFVNGSVHYIHTGDVWSATWGLPETMTKAQ
jgi:hypothetical protein